MLILALALLHSFVFYPAEIVDAAAGFLYGFFPALALVMTGWLLSGLICFAIGRSLARPLLDRWFGTERFERVEATIERGGATLLLAMRLIPILPFSLVSYAAGAARVPTWRFIWTTAIGYLPITALAVYFGTKLEGLSLTDPTRARHRRRAAGAAASPGTGSSGARRRMPALPRLLDPEAEDGRASVDVAERVAGLDPQLVLAALVLADELRRAGAKGGAVDPADEGRAGLVGAEAERRP